MYDITSDSANFVSSNSDHRNLNIHLICIERDKTCQSYNNPNYYYTQMDRAYNCNYKSINTNTRQLTNMEAITTGFYKFLARFSGEYKWKLYYFDKTKKCIINFNVAIVI